MQNSLPGSFIAVGNIPQAYSAYRSDPLSLLFGLCDGAMRTYERVFMYKERLIRTSPHWLRDYVLTLKGLKYIQGDVVSFPEFLLENQHESGFFYEILAPITDMHSGVAPSKDDWRIVDEPYRKHEAGSAFGLVRLELEADIEYFMVEGCYQIWQATGDDAWLERALPHLERGLQYMTTSSIRWDDKYQLVKRPHTLDTWDFTNRTTSNYYRMITPEDPMGIFHGDNTGLYYAKTLMAKMYRYLGKTPEAKRHEQEAQALRERIMAHLWNGQFFRHFLMLDEADYGVDETRQMSLSNAYALNRGILTLAEKKSVLAAYRACREKYHGVLDDFRNLEPPYPQFNVFKAGAYVNGGTAPFIAGQLAQAAFEAGEEEYGADILDRIGCKFLQDGKISFLYNWEGQDSGGGPRCWSGAEVMNAMTTGLAGVVDSSKLFQDVTISPRFAAAKEHHAYVRLEYPASKAFCEYEWRASDDYRTTEVVVKSTHKSCTLRVYAQKGLTPTACAIDGVKHDFTVEDVAGSKYAVIQNPPPDATVRVEFQFLDS